MTKRCLICEDEPLARQLIGRVLAGHFACDVAVSGAEAVELFALALDNAEPYELVTMDVVMPVMDGLETLAALRRLEDLYGVTGSARAVVFIITAVHDQEVLAETVYRSSAAGYLKKPLDREQLLAALAGCGLS